MTKARLIVAILAMLGAGLTTSEIASRLESEGVTKNRVRRMVGRLDDDKGDAGVEPSRTLAIHYADGGQSETTGLRLKGKRDRDPDSRREGKFFALVKGKNRAAARAAVVATMCGDFAVAECATSWAPIFTRRSYCRKRLNGKPAATVQGFGAEWALTKPQRLALESSFAALVPPPLVSVRRATRRKVRLALAALATPLMRCAEPVLP